jgi:aspartate dehydrogenase
MPTRLAVAGLGAIGRVLVETIDRGELPGYVLSAFSSKDLGKAQLLADKLSQKVVVVPADQLAGHADLLIECAPAAALDALVRPFLMAGKPVVVLSVGGLIKRPELIELARANHTAIHVPSGAILGLDAVLAAAEGKIQSVHLSTRKPPDSLLGAPFIVANNISLERLQEPVQVFAGNAIEAVAGFPANINVVAALALAGIGAERTQVEIWADPGVSRNIHTITVASDAAQFTMQTENLPSENPKTSRLVVQSLIALLRKLSAPLRLGT